MKPRYIHNRVLWVYPGLDHNGSMQRSERRHIGWAQVMNLVPLGRFGALTGLVSKKLRGVEMGFGCSFLTEWETTLNL